MHLTIQIEDNSEIALRTNSSGNYEILISDPDTVNATTMIEISKTQMAALDLLRAQQG